MTDSLARHFEDIIEAQAALATAVFDLDGFMQLAVERLRKLTGCDGAVIELAEGDDMVYRAATGTVAAHVGLRLPRSGSISGLCVAEGRILLSDDTEDDSRVNREACRKVHARSMLVMPLFQNAETVGVVKLVSREPSAFGFDEIETLRLMAGLLGGALGHQIDIDRRRKGEDRLRQIANTDSLTGLSNRMRFHEQLAAAIERSEAASGPLALMYMDLDGFKNVNDTLGHAAGDALLIGFAQRLRGMLRQSDVVARLGGDEFAVIAENVRDADAARHLAETIITATRAPFELPEGQTATIGVSVGLVTFNGGEKDPMVMLNAADAALYRVKRRGGRGVEVGAST